MQINKTIALVSGGGSGLGAATAHYLAKAGARVAILDFDLARAEEVVKSIDGVAVQADVSDQKAVERAIVEAEAQLGACPRIAINCAGIGSAARIVGRGGKTSFDVFDRTMKINLYGTYHVMTHVAQRMMELEPLEGGERGVIINTASVAFQDGQLGQAAYAASKGAIASLCLPAAREFSRFGIRVMTIAPGLFHTPMMEGLPEDVVAEISKNIPFPDRLGMPEEYAMLAGQIITNPYLNGTTIRLDGAARLPPR